MTPLKRISAKFCQSPAMFSQLPESCSFAAEKSRTQATRCRLQRRKIPVGSGLMTFSKTPFRAQKFSYFSFFFCFQRSKCFEFLKSFPSAQPHEISYTPSSYNSLGGVFQRFSRFEFFHDFLGLLKLTTQLWRKTPLLFRVYTTPIVVAS